MTEATLYDPVCHKGLVWDAGFHVRKSPATGPGYYIFARRPEYGGNYVRLVARPDVPSRKHPHYNCKVQRGWRTYREACRACDQLTSDMLAPLSPHPQELKMATPAAGFFVVRTFDGPTRETCRATVVSATPQRAISTALANGAPFIEVAGPYPSADEALANV